MERKFLLLLQAACMVAALAFGFALAWNGLFNDAGFYTPTFDNAMLWAARARIIGDTGHYAETEVVFGGVTKTYHVPFWPSLVAGFQALSGLNLYWAIRAVSLVQILLLGLAVYLLAKKVSGGSKLAGATAAFLAYNSPNLMTWGTRTTPISWGVVLLAFGLWAVAEKRTWLAALTAIALAFDHQPSLLVFVVSLFLFFAASNAKKLGDAIKQKMSAQKFLRAVETAPVAAGLVAFFSYMAWHVRQTGFSCLTFSCLPQAGAREFGKSIPLAPFVTKFPSAFGAVGVAAVVVSSLQEQTKEKKACGVAGIVACGAGVFLPSVALLFAGVLLLLYALSELHEELLLMCFIAGALLLVKNDALGAGVFTERFLTHLDEALAVAGGCLAARIVGMLESFENNSAK